jgi:hypothetical protein
MVCYSRWSGSAKLGTTKDKRKIGKTLFPPHRKATVSRSATSNVLVRLEFRAVTDLKGVTSGFDRHLDRAVQFERPDTLPVEHDVIGATTDLHTDGLCAARIGHRPRRQRVLGTTWSPRPAVVEPGSQLPSG